MENKQLEAILEEWLDTAITTSYLGVTIDDTRTEEDRRNLYLKYRAEAAKQIDELYRQRFLYAVGDDSVIDVARGTSLDGKNYIERQAAKSLYGNQLRAEINNRWVEYPELDKEM